jgi:BirA family transcriptional regulator, biotin operon repressor / biotin---[acetyl-CoA-carboxylase] ligase
MQTESQAQPEQFAKLAGILIEVQGDMEGPSQAVIGIGLNLRLPDALKQQIDQAVTDVHSALGQACDSNRLLAGILQQLHGVLDIFAQQGFAALREEWLSYHAYQGRTVYLLMPDASHISGVVTGVADDGMLLVRSEAGEQRFSAGEISLRGQIT